MDWDAFSGGGVTILTKTILNKSFYFSAVESVTRIYGPLFLFIILKAEDSCDLSLADISANES